ncbi:hypothetical protein D3C83_264070 [compost metagenome]
MNDAVPMSKITGPSSDGKPKQMGLVPSIGRAAPGGSTRGCALETWNATSPSRTIFSAK